ncbi:hypothetical protein [Arthrobacter sp. FW306-06-A]|uniref:hypothetical protein n=1 Tax=Arthrobacter sp. FW306-06-A TaxID=2879621 RepID=UPI001F2F5C49|nr:hypothetical protein [Arthrobacter sp. FW306-06-A]UKA73055.1 hypothetical protein LFT49_10200 [Arthrobacter sp. FW306-06-A]
MTYSDFSSIVLALVGVALIVFRRPLSRLQLTALATFERFRKNPTIYLKRLRVVAVVFGVLFMLIGIFRYVAT